MDKITKDSITEIFGYGIAVEIFENQEKKFLESLGIIKG